MPIQSSGNTMRRPLLRVCAVLSLAICGLAGIALAQDQGSSAKIYAVTHVDIVPTQKAVGTKLVQQYVADTRKDPGLVRIEAGAEISRDNHIAIVEVWQDRKAYDEHIANAHTRQFRQQIDPMLGSPYDERLHHSLE
jgi:quinol monooxygenase YgiN